MLALDLGKLGVRITANGTQFIGMMDRVQAKMLSTSQAVSAMGMKMSLALTLPLVLIARHAVKSFASFDDAMTKSTAIMGDMSASMRKEMETTAETISTKSVTSAVDLAESYFFLASAGLDAAQSIKALSVVEKFAVAGAFDMSQATDLLTDAQSALGLTVKDTEQNMINMTKLSDILVRANTLANASVEQFSNALTAKAATAMKSFNIEVEEGVSVLAAYANQGIKAQLAGNLFARMLRLLIKSVNENEDAFIAMNIPVKDAFDNLLPLADIIQSITKATAHMGTTARGAALTMLGFEARVQDAILPVLGLSNKIREYEKNLRSAGGFTQMVADKQLKSFIAQMKILGNRVTLVAKTIGNSLVPAIRAVSSAIESGLKWWNSLSERVQRAIVMVGTFLAVLGPALLILGKLMALGTFIVRVIASIVQFIFWIGGLISSIWAAGAVIIALVNGPLLAMLVGMATFVTAVYLVLKALGIWDLMMKVLGDTWDWLTELFEEKMELVKTTFEAIKNALLDGEFGLAAEVMWAAINLEFAKGLNYITSQLGDFYDMFKWIFSGIATVALSVASVISHTVLTVIEGLVDAVAWLLKGIAKVNVELGTISEAEYGDFVGGVNKFQNSVSGTKSATNAAIKQALENETKRRADPTGLAHKGQVNLEIAAERFTSLIARANKNAEAEAKKTVETDKKATAATTATTGSFIPRSATGDVNQALGGFRASQLSAVGGGSTDEDQAQNTREEQLEVAKETRDAVRAAAPEAGATEEGTIVLQ